MAGKTFRVGIVGASPGIATGVPHDYSHTPLGGEITTSHTQALSFVPGVELVAVCDLIPKMLDDFKRNWSHRWPDTRLYTDHKEMLARESVDILAVATPDNVHTPIVLDGVDAGVKGILCEKPLATSLEDADRMIKACEDRGVVLTVDHTRRWSPIFHKVRDAIRAGDIGQLSTIVGNLGGPRAMLFRNGTHLIDAMCFFAESEPVKVFAHLEEGFEDWDRYRGDGGTLPEKDPGASGFVLFRNGVRALYNGTKGTVFDHGVQLTGPDGQIRFGLQDLTAQLRIYDRATRQESVTTLSSDQFQVQGLVAAYHEMLDVVEAGATSISPAREARKTLQIMLGFLKSHQEGSRLVDVPA